MFEISENGQVIEPLNERLRGRYLCEDFVDFRTGEVLVSHHDMVNAQQANLIEKKLREQAEAEGDPDRNGSRPRPRAIPTARCPSGCAPCSPVRPATACAPSATA